MPYPVMTVMSALSICLLAWGCDDDGETSMPGADRGTQINDAMTANPLSDAAVSDARIITDMNAQAVDLGRSIADAGGAVADAQQADAGTPSDSALPQDVDALTTDAGVADAGLQDEFAGRPVGQCTQNSDCPAGPNGQMCSPALPGGACTGCGTDDHCPGDAVCNLGTCVTQCNDVADCPPGLRCLGSGRCAAVRCEADECPVSLFGCSDSGQCSRRRCDAQMDCPEQTTCTSGWCVENRAL